MALARIEKRDHETNRRDSARHRHRSREALRLRGIRNRPLSLCILRDSRKNADQKRRANGGRYLNESVDNGHAMGVLVRRERLQTRRLRRREDEAKTAVHHSRRAQHSNRRERRQNQANRNLPGNDQAETHREKRPAPVPM